MLTPQPTQLPGLYLWFWCFKCDGNPECALCGGSSYVHLSALLPLRTHKYGVINWNYAG